MQRIIMPNKKEEIIEGNYGFSIVKVVEDQHQNVLQVLYELTSEEGSSKFLLQEYIMQLENEDLYKVMYLSHESQTNSPIVVNTDDLINCCGSCEVKVDEHGNSFIDMNTICFDATLVADIRVNEY